MNGTPFSSSVVPHAGLITAEGHAGKGYFLSEQAVPKAGAGSAVGSGRPGYKGFSELASSILDIARKVINLAAKPVDENAESFSYGKTASHHQEYNHVGIYRDCP